MHSSTRKPRLQSEHFHPLRGLLERRIGLEIDPDQAPQLEERLSGRLAQLGFRDFGAYLSFLERGRVESDEELSLVLEALTPAETYFFRNAEQLALLEEAVLPELASRRAKLRRLRLWSAGCSTGEEAYTLAMLLDRSRLFHDWELSVAGTDLCDSRLRQATQGVYSGGALRAIEPEKLPRWFEKRDSRWAVTARIRQLTRFQKLNLLHHSSSLFFSEMDVVVCRNVLIYLTSAARDQVLRTLCCRLAAGGYLLLGHSETAGLNPAELGLQADERGLVYRKLGPGVPSPLPPLRVVPRP